MTPRKKHFAEIKGVLWRVLFLNLLVALAKIIFGFISNSSSILADGFHSLSDGISNIIALIGIHFSSQPKDAEHPYGHKKFETLFALGIAAMLLFVSFNLFKVGALKIFKPAIPKVEPISFIIMIFTLIINAFVMKYEYCKGERLNSDLLIADSQHTKADMLTSFSVIIALISVKFGYPILDPIVTVFISIFIAVSGFKIIMMESSVLCDAVAITDIKKIKDIVMRIEGVKNCHKIRSHGRPDDIHIDLHVLVDKNMTMEDSHQLSHKIQKEIKVKLPQVTNVFVHMEPI